LFVGSIQMAGQSQSPRGSLATTSTRPKRIDRLFFVLMREDMTGGMTVSVVMLETTPQAV
jgi:hypothetical protein